MTSEVISREINDGIKAAETTFDRHDAPIDWKLRPTESSFQ